MRDLNWYTFTLFTLGLYALMGTLLHLQPTGLMDVVIITLLIVALDLFPIRLPSGDVYGAGTLGYVFLLVADGLFAWALACILSLLVYFVRNAGSVRKVNWFRYFVTLGMYFICAMLSILVIHFTAPLSVYLSVGLAFAVFEVANTLLLAGIGRIMAGTGLFDDFLLKLKELIVPTVISMLVIPYLTKYESTNLLSAIGFLGVFLVVVIVISHEYAKESSYRRNMTREIVKLLEQKIMTGQIGHGNRVGAICELLLEKVNYPKKQRNNLIQLAIIHDIGKVVLPLHVFNRRGALTLSEEQAYQSHCEKGAKLIASIYQDERFAKWIHDHHERWDGKGFPNRKQGEAIPFEARILGLANHLDHLFMRQRDLQTVDQLLHGVSGTILDPSLVQLIDLELLTEIKEIYDDNSVALEVRPKEEIVASSEAANEASSFLGHLIYGSYSKGRLQWVTDTEAPTDKVTFLAEKALQSGRSFHELIEQEGKTFDMHFQVQHDHVSVIGNDVTSLIEFRSRLNRKILDSYRDVIKTVTQEKVLVCLQEREISEQLGGFVGSIQVQKATDVAATRKFVSKCMAPYVSGSDLIRIQLAVSEGATNLLKHAQDGVVSVFQQVGSVQVLFADQGSGIPLHELPKTVLVSGYSSKLSLGKGFSIMTKSAERMVIHTCSKGTQILLEFGTGETAESGKEG